MTYRAFHASIFTILLLGFLTSCGTYTSFDKAMQNPEDVKKLTLSRKKIGVLPADIARLSKLEELRLFKCNLHELPPEIGLLTNLKILVISDNKLTEIPKEIGQLKKLEELSLHHNNIKGLPQEITQLTNLRRLNISNNQLEELPVGIGNMSNLQYLYLQQNNISFMDPEIMKLQKLSILNLERNDLAEVPEFLGELPAILELYLAYASGGDEQIPESICTNLGIELVTVSRTSILPACIDAPKNNILKVQVK